MGYYTDLAKKLDLYGGDYSFTPPDVQLLWRLDDLLERQEELAQQERRYYCGAIYPENELRYILPEHLKDPDHLQAAIDLAIRDLKDRYDIDVLAEDREEPVVDEITDMQVSIRDVLTMQFQMAAQSAA